MSTPGGAIPIVIELGAGCEPLARARRLDIFCERLAGEVDDMLARLGLAGRAVVEVVECGSRRPLRIRVRGALQPYPAGLLRRLWHVIAPDDLRALADEAPGEVADLWFAEYVAEHGESAAAPDWSLAFELIQRVVRDALWERAGCLTGAEQAEAFLRGASLNGDPPLSPADMLGVQRGLVDLAVPVAARERLIQTVERCVKLGLSQEDTFEEALAIMRPRRIELLAESTFLGRFVGGERLTEPIDAQDERVDPAVREAFLAVERVMLVGRGVRMPAIELVPTTKLRADMAAVRVNGRAHPFSARTDELELEMLTQRLGEELARRAYMLLDVQEVEIRVGQLQELFPSLVEALVARLSLADLTRILRELLREGVSIHDLKTIFELLLAFGTVPVDPERLVVFDERLPLAYRPARADWRSRLEFVRRGLSYQLSAAWSRDGRLDVIVVEPALAGEATSSGLNGGGRGLGEAEQEAVRDRLFAQLVRLRPEDPPPVVFTGSGGRAAIRTLLAPEFPDLPVMAAAELRRGIDVHEVGRLGLPAAVGSARHVGAAGDPGAA